ncbi:MAG: hypothetical protein ACHP9T_00210 [Caulobacterales bacterium]|jgi:hypothetical protein
MPDLRPRPPDRKLALIAPLVIVAAVGVMLAIGLRSPQHAPPTSTPPPIEPVAAPRPAATPVSPLSRAELIWSANAAAAAYAADEAAAPAKSPLIGRQFSVRIAFGCDGPQSSGGPDQARMDYDPGKQTLRLSATPVDWASLPLVQDLRDAKDIESAEGFWIPRPWSPSDACPAPRKAAVPAIVTPPAAQTLGLAQIFKTGDSRLLRRDGRPYEVVRKVKADAPLLAHSFRIVLEGRIAGYGDGRAIHCWSESPDHRPICLYAVNLDRVAIEDGVTGDVLGEWRN